VRKFNLILKKVSTILKFNLTKCRFQTPKGQAGILTLINIDESLIKSQKLPI